MSYKPPEGNEPSVFVYVPFLNTETNRFQGKIHLAKSDNGEVFCGNNKLLFEINQVGLDWVTQADPNSELCQRCKSLAEKHLSRK
ncbi:TPA: hypothetical protein ACPVZG_000599 [Vibrio parahaemolyticus]|uniref:Uncharacterized protein n=1 Tax=Vibrio parahaemolyticus TaxID=670 RepID=A0AAW8Q0V8_VIBPH|nr:hypothetical protein [Vibrio parahaemolyticus]MDS1821305.1 hypothetical protein [Vibrio parahaemolyticus]